MKLKYEKPAFYVENFSLTQAYALGCGWDGDDYGPRPTHADKTVCGWDDGYGGIVWAAKPQCENIIPENVDVGGFCYNNPNGGITVFAS